MIDYIFSFLIGLKLKLFGRTTLAKLGCGLSTLNENRKLAIYKLFKYEIYIVDVSHFQYRSSQRKINVPKLRPTFMKCNLFQEQHNPFLDFEIRLLKNSCR